MSTLSMPQARASLARLAEQANEWAGIPVPIEGTDMVIAKGYPYAECFRKPADPADQDFRIINSWFSKKKRAWVHIVELLDGHRCTFIEPKFNHTTMLLSTMGSACAWDLNAEIAALEKLKGLLKPHLFEMYLLTGMFLETSPRSQKTYIFRRLRPTLALRREGERMEIACALCLHPIGYYRETWAGALCPTDDVIAHLLLMRADEPFLWRKANQIPASWPEAGIG